jgi:hypothetical protein
MGWDENQERQAKIVLENLFMKDKQWVISVIMVE